MGAGGLLSYAVERVFAAVEHDQCDTAAGNAGEYGGYGALLFGGAGFVMYGVGECDDFGGEFCGLQRDRGEWDVGRCVDGAGL